MEAHGPIGVFDSGVGGLSVVLEIIRQLPGESIIYFGDTAHVPYGPRPARQLVGFADAITGFLVRQGAGVVVDACNSTSAVALPFLRKKYPVPILGVIEPGVEAALRVTRQGRIGVIGTEVTVMSEAYPQAFHERRPGMQVISRACPEFVPLVEAGRADTLAAFDAAHRYLGPLRQAGFDTMVLGCTHYPFLTKIIKSAIGEVTLVDPAEETVRQLAAILIPSPEGHGAHRFFVSGSVEPFRTVGQALMGDAVELSQVEQVLLDGEVGYGG